VHTVVVDGRVVVADGRHVLGDVGALLAAAIEPLWADADEHLVTGIGELVTNDPALGDGPLGLVADAAVVVDDGRSPGSARRRGAPAADRRIDVGGRAVLPGSSTATPTWSSPATGPRSSRPGWPAPLRRRRHRLDRRRHPRGDRRRAARAGWRLVAEMRAQGTTTVEVKSGYGLTVDDEARALRLAGEVTRRRRSSARTSSRRSTPTAGRLRRPGHRADARRLRAARPVDRRVLRAVRRLHRLRRAGHPAHPARARASCSAA
jgi:hypothetical protein